LGVQILVVAPNLAIAESQTRALNALVEQADDARPDAQFKTDLFGKPLTIGGELSFDLRYRQDIDLDENQKGDVTDTELQAQVELLYEFARDTSFFTEIKGSYAAEIATEDDDKEDDDSLKLGELWVFKDQLAGSQWSMQLGRQAIAESREWWWDQDLDALRLRYAGEQYQFEAALAEEIGFELGDSVSAEDEEIRRYFLRFGTEFAPKQRLEGFLLHQNDRSGDTGQDLIIKSNDEDNIDANLSWIGLRAIGKLKKKPLGRFKYWADFATVIGSENRIDYAELENNQSRIVDSESRDVLAYAADVGLSWRTRLPAKPWFTLSWAYGSGDNKTDTKTDHNFRQTGLQDNNGKYFGLNSFRYYGELLRPELSNLSILTFAAGLKTGKQQTLELVQHVYRQAEADNTRIGRPRAKPNGNNADIGQELDVIYGVQKWAHLELEAIAAVFRPGGAFDESADTAYQFELELTYNF
jgi:hypothetical protein